MQWSSLCRVLWLLASFILLTTATRLCTAKVSSAENEVIARIYELVCSEYRYRPVIVKKTVTLGKFLTKEVMANPGFDTVALADLAQSSQKERPLTLDNKLPSMASWQTYFVGDAPTTREWQKFVQAHPKKNACLVFASPGFNKSTQTFVVYCEIRSCYTMTSFLAEIKQRKIIRFQEQIIADW